ncbi:MAG: IS110 family transposase [Rhodospirillales bacterium]
MEFKRIAIDTSKQVFTLHGVDQTDRPVLRRNLGRAQMEKFFAQQAPTEVVMEACGSAHHWGRTLQAMGHRVRLLPPQYVKPFVKRGKNDRNDAEAISEAASRPGMRSVPVKSAERQAEAMLLSSRDMLIGQRTQLINAVRGHAAEFGVIAARGTAHVEKLLQVVADSASGVPARAQAALALYGRRIAELDADIAVLDREIAAQHKASKASQRQATQPGVGPILALALTLTVDHTQFESGRHFAAWLGLTPRERSTGGRQRLGGISREGNERLRQLFVLGATAVIRVAKPGSKLATGWLLQLLERKPRKLAAVALANKMARIAWAMMSRGEAYRQSKPVAA